MSDQPAEQLYDEGHATLDCASARGSTAPSGRRLRPQPRGPAVGEHTRAAPCRTIGEWPPEGVTRFTPLRDVFVQRHRATPLRDAVAVALGMRFRIETGRHPRPPERRPLGVARAHPVRARLDRHASEALDRYDPGWWRRRARPVRLQPRRR